ncbi:MAG: YceD family protein [Halochromatium sp.]
MSVSFPDLLDPRKAVAQRSVFEGEMALGRLPRLSRLLWRGGEAASAPTSARTPNQAHYRFEFGRDTDGRSTVLGRVVAELPLCCQRCFERYDLKVDAEVALALVEGLDEAKALPAEYEPLMLEDRLMRASDLVEDELILAVPAIPRHPEGACKPPPVPSTVARLVGLDGDGAALEADRKPGADRHPFATLAALKTPRDDTESQD